MSGKQSVKPFDNVILKNKNICVHTVESNVGGTFGAAGALVIVLLWTYYSSIILYFGAEFTKAYALAYGSEIHPNHYALTVKEMEQGSAFVQSADKGNR